MKGMGVGRNDDDGPRNLGFLGQPAYMHFEFHFPWGVAPVGDTVLQNGEKFRPSVHTYSCSLAGPETKTFRPLRPALKPLWLSLRSFLQGLSASDVVIVSQYRTSSPTGGLPCYH